MAHTATQMRYGDKHMNDNKAKPRMAVRGEWYGDIFEPDTPHHKLPQEAILAKQAEDKAKERKQRVRLGKRAAKGKDWDGTADNDNINWPLATSLVREGNTELLKTAMAYRRLHGQAYSGAVLGGSGVVMREGFALDRHSKIREDGTIAYKHVRQRSSAGVDIPARQYVPPFEDEDTQAQHNSIKVPRPWNGDKPVNDMFDAQGKLADIRHRLGYLAEPLEMAVVDGKTYEKIGNEICRQAHKVPATAAGRAIVHLALITARDAFGHIKREDLAA